jgi:hypothetical protein
MSRNLSQFADTADRRLFAHELAHVAQWRSGSTDDQTVVRRGTKKRTLLGKPKTEAGDLEDFDKTHSVFVERDATIREIAAMALTLWNDATNNSGDPLTVDTLAKALLVFNADFLGLERGAANMSNFWVGMRLPLPITAPADSSPAAAKRISRVDPGAIRAYAGQFDPAWAPLLDKRATRNPDFGAMANDAIIDILVSAQTIPGQAKAATRYATHPEVLQAIVTEYQRTKSADDRREFAAALLEAFDPTAFAQLTSTRIGHEIVAQLEQELVGSNEPISDNLANYGNFGEMRVGKNDSQIQSNLQSACSVPGGNTCILKIQKHVSLLHGDAVKQVIKQMASFVNGAVNLDPMMSALHALGGVAGPKREFSIRDWKTDCANKIFRLRDCDDPDLRLDEDCFDSSVGSADPYAFENPNDPPLYTPAPMVMIEEALANRGPGMYLFPVSINSDHTVTLQAIKEGAAGEQVSGRIKLFLIDQFNDPGMFDVTDYRVLNAYLFHWAQNRKKKKSTYQRCALPPSYMWQMFPTRDIPLMEGPLRQSSAAMKGTD